MSKVKKWKYGSVGSIISDFDGLKVEDTSQVSDSYIGEVLHVNDHGNITLYNAKNGKLTEVWSLV